MALLLCKGSGPLAPFARAAADTQLGVLLPSHRSKLLPPGLVSAVRDGPGEAAVAALAQASRLVCLPFCAGQGKGILMGATAA